MAGPASLNQSARNSSADSPLSACTNVSDAGSLENPRRRYKSKGDAIERAEKNGVHSHGFHVVDGCAPKFGGDASSTAFGPRAGIRELAQDGHPPRDVELAHGDNPTAFSHNIDEYAVERWLKAE